ncbi:MAG TPA: SCP2 sterol-binding domain-containing protein [Acidimicrobiales bacterium]|jgi:hypothetical protein
MPTSRARSSPKATPPVSPTSSYFDELGRRGFEPLLRKISGRVRFDLADDGRTESWLVTIDHGQLQVTRAAREAECIIRGDRAVFDEIVSGRANGTAAVLRGALSGSGDMELMFAIQRILPEPPRGWDPTVGTRSA